MLEGGRSTARDPEALGTLIRFGEEGASLHQLLRSRHLRQVMASLDALGVGSEELDAAAVGERLQLLETPSRPSVQTLDKTLDVCLWPVRGGPWVLSGLGPAAQWPG